MRAFVFFCVGLLIAAGAQAQTFPDYDSVYVNDFAELLPDEREREVEAMLVELREETGIEFTVVTISRLGDYGWSGAIEPFATGLFNAWGVGDAARNDGVMLLISRFDRRLRIELGRGYAQSYDARMKRIIDDEIVPHFRRDDYAEGIATGVREVIYDVAGAYPGAFDASAASRIGTGIARVVGPPQWWWSIGAAPFGAWALFAYRRLRRNRPRRCPVHDVDMHRVEEFVDDEHLNPGQRLEEQLESVDYDVWRCDACGHVTIEAYKSWFSRYGACPSCAYKTLEGDETVLRSPTKSSAGLKRIDYLCRHCGHAYDETRSIPKLSDRSSSSGGSFGGGSSSGGGASGGW